MRWSDPKIEALVKQLLWAKSRLKVEVITRRRIAACVGLARATVDSIATGRIGWPARWLAQKGPVTARQRRRRRGDQSSASEDQDVDFRKVAPYRCPHGHGLMRFTPCVHCVAVGLIVLPPQKAVAR